MHQYQKSYAFDAERRVPPNSRRDADSSADSSRSPVSASDSTPSFRLPDWARRAPERNERFVMAMAVPNITGTLHIGHALDLLLQDVVVRHRAQCGYVLHFPPGTDHAGLGAQRAAERELERSGSSRRKLGRQAFGAYMQTWKNKHEALILEQMRELDLAAQFERTVHSIDEPRQHLIEAAFRLMWERDWIYRELALVNWCPTCGSCIGGQEIERRECTETLYRIRAKGAGEEVEIGTLHLELLLGATELGVSRQHPRFDELVGREVLHPLSGTPLLVKEVPERGRELDSFLTLVLPSYNAADFDVARRDNTSLIPIYDEFGTIADLHGDYAGLTPEACHEKIRQRLDSAGLLAGTLDYLQGQAYHRLCGAQVRPRPTQVWFLRTRVLKDAARELLEETESRTNDPKWEAQVRAALEAVAGHRAESGNRWWEGACLALVQDFSSNRDWILSRQNEWGYRVPAFHCESCGEIHVGAKRPERCTRCAQTRLLRDPDVLDVLFHSALWALMVGEDPERNPHADCAALGADILEFWLPTAELWAKALYGKRSIGRALVHGLVCDAEGRKMSKSLGNALDLEEVLKTFPLEALRAAVFTAMTGGDGQELVPLHEQALRDGDGWHHELMQTLSSYSFHHDSAPSSKDHLERLEAEMDRLLEPCQVGAAYRTLLESAKALTAGQLAFDRPDFLRWLRLLYPFHPQLAERVAVTHRLEEAS